MIKKKSLLKIMLPSIHSYVIFYELTFKFLSFYDMSYYIVYHTIYWYTGIFKKIIVKKNFIYLFII